MNRIAIILILISTALIGCGVSDPNGQSKNENTQPATKEDSPEDESMNSTELSKTYLLKWLKSVQSKMVLIPVVIQADPLGISSARIGATTEKSSAEPLELSLDDSGMGISLHDSIRQYKDPNSNTCIVWLKGRAGTLLELPIRSANQSTGKDRPFDFTVFEVIGRVEDENARPKLF